jgi:hypothetical protein
MLTSEDTKQEKIESMAVAVDMPPASSSPELEKAQEPFLSRLNNFLHSNIYVYLITYYLYWLGFWLFMPLAGFFTMLGFGLYDLFTAKGFRKPCGPVLITGTSSGFGLDLTLQLAAQGWKVRAGGERRQIQGIVWIINVPWRLYLFVLFLTRCPCLPFLLSFLA